MADWDAEGDATYDSYHFGDHTPQQEEPIYSTQPTQGSTSRNKYWNIEEDRLLCKARMNAMSCSIVGTDQNSSQFWGRVMEFYHDIENHEEGTIRTRTLDSLKQRWKKIRIECGKWRGHWSEVTALYHTGANADDLWNKANKMYKEDMKGKDFTLLHCWDILKDYDKWGVGEEEPVHKRQRTDEPVNMSTSESGATPTSNRTRPLGTKAAKAAARRQGSSSNSILSDDSIRGYNEALTRNSESSSKLAAALEVSANVEKEKAMLENRKFYMDIINYDISHLHGEELEYYKELKRDARTKLRQLF